MLDWVPAGSLLMGVPYYGYDWPVTSTVPNAKVQSDKTTYGKVKSVTYASARDWLAAHPGTPRQYDALEGSAFYTYYSNTYKTYRQVYFEEERSLADKYDYAIVTGLAGIGIWTLDNDKGYDDLWNVLRAKFYAPVHQVAVLGSVVVTRKNGIVYATIKGRARDDGTVPERGRFSWSIRDAKGHLAQVGDAAEAPRLSGPQRHRDPEGPTGHARRASSRASTPTASGSWSAPGSGARPRSRSTSGTEPAPDEIPSRMGRLPRNIRHGSIVYRPCTPTTRTDRSPSPPCGVRSWSWWRSR